MKLVSAGATQHFKSRCYVALMITNSPKSAILSACYSCSPTYFLSLLTSIMECLGTVKTRLALWLPSPCVKCKQRSIRVGVYSCKTRHEVHSSVLPVCCCCRDWGLTAWFLVDTFFQDRKSFFCVCIYRVQQTETFNERFQTENRPCSGAPAGQHSRLSVIREQETHRGDTHTTCWIHKVCTQHWYLQTQSFEFTAATWREPLMLNLLQHLY